MGKIRLGIIAPADIAKRRFLPALLKCEEFEFVGIAARSGSEDKAAAVIAEAGINAKVYEGYESLFSDENVDAVYIPLPPSMHFEWGKKALLAGKHVFMEKPFCVNSKETEELISLAKEKQLALYENYGCLFHNQLELIDDLVKKGEIGEISLIRAAFGFPYRGETDFRYAKDLGGGALLDAGGYCMKIARHFMGECATVKYSNLTYGQKHDCDMFGTVVLEDENSLTAQLSFGMNNQYKCELELWGTKGYMVAPRIFTAPDNFEPEITVTCGMDKKVYKAKSTDQFAECIKRFGDVINNKSPREDVYANILKGSKDIDLVFEKAVR